MTSIDLNSAHALSGPPHVPSFSQPVRLGAIVLSAVLALLCLIYDWPFERLGVFQPMMLALGFALVQYVIEIPFRGLAARVATLAVFIVAALSAWLAWYSNDQMISQATADSIWKVTSVAYVFGFVGLTFWNAPYKNFHSKIAAIPMMWIVLFAFIGSALWTITYSFTSAKILPVMKLVGFAQYTRLFKDDVWQISVYNALIYIGLTVVGSFVLGFLIAVFMDQKIRFEGLFRVIYLYPIALSFIVTGHVWAWIMSPVYGLQKSMRQMGWESFSFDWIGTTDKAIYCVVLAGLWQGTGLVMALMLAGLRGIDDEVWKAARVDGIPKWRTYLQVVLPMMRPVLITTFVLVASGAVRVYDLIVALTDGGPGISTNVPSVYVYKYLFGGSIGQGLAASTIMLIASAIILIPWVYVEFVKNKQQR